MRERWETVVGAARYRVSDRGRVRNKRTGKLLRGNLGTNGYVKVVLKADDGRSKTCRVHRLVCTAFRGIPPSHMVCNHRDGVKRNNAAENLEWVTRAQNAAHASRLGLLRGQPGELNPKAKLRAGDVLEMRRLAKDGMTFKQLGHRFGVTAVTAYRAVVGLTWRHGGPPRTASHPVPPQ